jgi:hypothetical protein
MNSKYCEIFDRIVGLGGGSCRNERVGYIDRICLLTGLESLLWLLARAGSACLRRMTVRSAYIEKFHSTTHFNNHFMPAWDSSMIIIPNAHIDRASMPRQPHCETMVHVIPT